MKRAQDLANCGEIEAILDLAIEAYLEKNDPVRREERRVARETKREEVKEAVKEEENVHLILNEGGDPNDGNVDSGGSSRNLIQLSCIENWKAATADKKKHSWGIYDEAGIFVYACKHIVVSRV